MVQPTTVNQAVGTYILYNLFRWHPGFNFSSSYELLLCWLLSDSSSAWTSGSFNSSSTSSGCTFLRSDLKEWDDLLLGVDLLDRELRLDFDSSCRRFWEMVVCRFFPEVWSELRVNQGCLMAWLAVSRSFGSSAIVLLIKSLASVEISFQCWKKKKEEVSVTNTANILKYNSQNYNSYPEA